MEKRRRGCAHHTGAGAMTAERGEKKGIHRIIVLLPPQKFVQARRPYDHLALTDLNVDLGNNKYFFSKTDIIIILIL